MSADNAKLIAELLREINDVISANPYTRYSSVAQNADVERERAERHARSIALVILKSRAALSAQSEPVAWGLRNNDGHGDIIGTSLVREEAEREAKVMSRMSLTVVPLYDHARPVASAQSEPVAWMYERPSAGKSPALHAVSLYQWSARERADPTLIETPLYAHPVASAQSEPESEVLFCPGCGCSEGEYHATNCPVLASENEAMAVDRSKLRHCPKCWSYGHNHRKDCPYVGQGMKHHVAPTP